MTKPISRKSQKSKVEQRETGAASKAQAASLQAASAKADRKPEQQPRAGSPVKSEKPAISLEFEYPSASQVYVAGTFNGWKPEATPLERNDNGRWVGNLAVTPGRYEYLFVVDGKWVPDPKARETVENPFGGKNSILSVTG